MSKKRASRNNKKVLKALKQKRVKYNLGSQMRDRLARTYGRRGFQQVEAPPPPVDKLEPLKQPLKEAALKLIKRL
jgi:hypothetical protein